MRNSRGFLLLEVMVSIVVITGGLLFVMRVYATAKNGLDISRDLFRYSLLLEEKIFEYEERGVIEEGKNRDHFPDREYYMWEVEASPLEPAGQELSNLCEVRLGAFQAKSSPAQKYYLNTYLEKENAQNKTR